MILTKLSEFFKSVRLDDFTIGSISTKSGIFKGLSNTVASPTNFDLFLKRRFSSVVDEDKGPLIAKFKYIFNESTSNFYAEHLKGLKLMSADFAQFFENSRPLPKNLAYTKESIEKKSF